jgi:hypothetical protein
MHTGRLANRRSLACSPGSCGRKFGRLCFDSIDHSSWCRECLRNTRRIRYLCDSWSLRNSLDHIHFRYPGRVPDFCHDHRFGHPRNIFPARQELAFAQTASRPGKISRGWPADYSGLAEMMIKDDRNRELNQSYHLLNSFSSSNCRGCQVISHAGGYQNKRYAVFGG